MPLNGWLYKGRIETCKVEDEEETGPTSNQLEKEIAREVKPGASLALCIEDNRNMQEAFVSSQLSWALTAGSMTQDLSSGQSCSACQGIPPVYGIRMFITVFTKLHCCNLS